MSEGSERREGLGNWGRARGRKGCVSDATLEDSLSFNESRSKKGELTSPNAASNLRPTLKLCSRLLPLRAQREQFQPVPSSEELGSEGSEQRKDAEDDVVEVDLRRGT